MSKYSIFPNYGSNETPKPSIVQWMCFPQQIREILDSVGIFSPIAINIRSLNNLIKAIIIRDE